MKSSNVRIIITRLLILIPFILLIFNGLVWLRWGIDVPYWDDWRTIEQDLGSFILSDLFLPANDTISPVGKFFESIFAMYMSYNIIAHQLITMIFLLGTILLSSYYIFDKSHLLWGLSFVLFIFILQPGAYWGLQTIAYHQAIPIAAILASLAVTISGRFSSILHTVIIAALGIISGFAYTSGAFAVLAAAIVSWICAARSDPAASRRLWQACIGYTIAAVITVPAQLWVILVYQHGAIHIATVPWTLPWDWEFWAFMFGIMARSVRFPFLPSWPLITLSAGIAVFAAILFAAFLALKTILSFNEEQPGERRSAYVLLCLVGAVGLYVFMVVVSRASLGGSPTNTWIDYLARGGIRFHFFWVSVLIPFVAAMLSRKLIPQTYQTTPVLLIVGAITILYACLAGVFTSNSYFKSVADTTQRPGIACIQRKLSSKDPVICDTLYPGDMSNAIMRARAMDLSFTRYLSFPERTIEFSMKGYSGGDLKVKASQNFEMEGMFDPQVQFTVSTNSLWNFGQCQNFTVSGQLNAQNPDTMQFFFLNKGQDSYSEDSSRAFSYQGGVWSQFEFSVQNRDGFSPSFRIDPGGTAQSYQIQNLSLTCQ